MAYPCGISGAMAVREASEFRSSHLCCPHYSGVFFVEFLLAVEIVEADSSLFERSPNDVTVRLDRLIADIRTRFHGPAMEPGASQSPSAPRDVLVVAHGHILRAFAARWVGRDVSINPNFLLEAGGVGTLSYEHESIDEPALLLGGAFVTDVVDEMEAEMKQKEKKGAK